MGKERGEQEEKGSCICNQRGWYQPWKNIWVEIREKLMKSVLCVWSAITKGGVNGFQSKEQSFFLLSRHRTGWPVMTAACAWDTSEEGAMGKAMWLPRPSHSCHGRGMSVSGCRVTGNVFQPMICTWKRNVFQYSPTAPELANKNLSDWERSPWSLNLSPAHPELQPSFSWFPQVLPCPPGPQALSASFQAPFCIAHITPASWACLCQLSWLQSYQGSDGTLQQQAQPTESMT